MIFLIGCLGDAVVQILHLLGKKQNLLPHIGEYQPIALVPEEQLNSASSFEMALLAAGCVMYSVFAARVMLPYSATLRKISKFRFNIIF